MKILRVNMEQAKVTTEHLPEEWKLIGGTGLIAKIMNKEVDPATDPLGPGNKLIIAAGPLAGTLAPQFGRISVGAKSPLTLGIKEANSGGTAAQKLDRLGYRAIIFEGVPKKGKLYCLKITKDGAELLPADDYKGMKVYPVAEKLQEKYGSKISIICIGPAGERLYRSASVSLTDMLGDPSRSAGRGGLGAVMGSKGLKAIVLDDSGAPKVEIKETEAFRALVKEWIDTLQHDIVCNMYSKFGTPFAVSNSSYQGTMPGSNYKSGQHKGFAGLTAEVIQANVFERGGKMHGCMPGCVVQCSILYPDKNGQRLAAAFEYEALALLGTNLDITDADDVARLKFICDNLGLDVIETGASLGVAASAGKMKAGDVQSAIKLLTEIEQGTELGTYLGNGVVRTAQYLGIDRVPAIKGQAIPGHDPRAVKGTGMTYATSPMGADHTAGLTYRAGLSKNQAKNSLRTQVKASACDTFGYCLNALPGGKASFYEVVAKLLSARYGDDVRHDDVVEMSKQSLKDMLKFNEGAEFGKNKEPLPKFVREEALGPTKHTFDVSEEEINKMWDGLDAFREPTKIWEMRLPKIPELLIGPGVFRQLGAAVKKLGCKKPLVVSGSTTKRLGRTDAVREILKKAGLDSAEFCAMVADPPVSVVEKAGVIYKKERCDCLIGVGGGSAMDGVKGIAVEVTYPGPLTEFDVNVGGAAKIGPEVPPIICIPTTSGTGSEANMFGVITDEVRNVKFPLVSEHLLPTLSIIDPEQCASMPKSITADTGLDALSHLVEGYVTTALDYNPYYDALALYGVKLIGQSLRKAYNNPNDITARWDMCMAAMFGGVLVGKGLGLAHAVAHPLGAHYHISHGRAVAIGMLCAVRANKKTCEEKYKDLAWALARTDNLEQALLDLFRDLQFSVKLEDHGVPREDFKKVAFLISREVGNIATNPAVMDENKILKLLEEL